MKANEFQFFLYALLILHISAKNQIGKTLMNLLPHLNIVNSSPRLSANLNNQTDLLDLNKYLDCITKYEELFGLSHEKLTKAF